MSYKSILIFLIFSGLLLAITYEQGKKILDEIRNAESIPYTKITKAFVSIVDSDKVTTEISADLVLIDSKPNNKKAPTVMEGNIEAYFYGEDKTDTLSVLKADFAEYTEDRGLVAKKNISIYNKETKDSLYFVNQLDSEIEWDEKAEIIYSNNEFIKIDSIGCTRGSSFHSKVDLTDMEIDNVKGSSRGGNDGCE